MYQYSDVREFVRCYTALYPAFSRPRFPLMILWFLLISSLSYAQNPKVFPYETHQKVLDNGLSVIVIPMDTPGVAQVRTWMAVGSRDEIDPGRTGFAHFFEHLMFYGTPSLSRTAREDRIQSLGAEENAWTWFDDTVYHATLASQHVETYLTMEGDRFQNLRLTEDMVRKEAGAVYGEFRKGQASPSNRLYETLYSTAFQTHTYHHDTIGTEKDIQDMPSAYAYSQLFFNRYYRPEHAAVIVVGDVKPEEVFGWTEKAYGPWKRAKTPRPSIPVEPAQTETREAQLTWPTPTAPRLALGWKTPPYDPDSSDYVALNLITSLLLGEVGPLKKRLVREENLAYSVHGEVDAFVDEGLFKIVVELKDAAHYTRAEEIIREELTKLSKKIEVNWFNETRTRDRYQTLTSLDNPDSVGSQLGWTWRRTQSTDAIDRFYATYDALTPQNVSEVAERIFIDTQMTRITLTSANGEDE